MRNLLRTGVYALALTLGVAAAQAADLPRQMPAKAPVYVEPPFTWTGFYVGINGGGAFGRSSFGPAFPTAFDTSGGLVGGTIGYNWQFNNFVFGLEGDAAWADIRGNAVCGAGVTCSVRSDFLATVRGRLGYAFDRFMPYVTGGLAVGNIRTGVTGFGTNDVTNAGYALGAGVEYAFARNWSAKLEYLYVDLDRGGTIAGTRARFDENIVRAGVNYHF
jgi:outer membrane immunogenic protein